MARGFLPTRHGRYQKGVNDSVRLLHGLISCRPPGDQRQFYRAHDREKAAPADKITHRGCNIIRVFFLRITEIRNLINISSLGKIIMRRLSY